MNASMTHNAPAVHLVPEVPGMDRIRGRSRGELADAVEFLAWYAPGIFRAVMDYMDTVDGELIPGRRQSPAPEAFGAAKRKLRRDNGNRRPKAAAPRACQHSGMGQEPVHVPCPACGASGESDPEASRWQCTSCGSGFFLRRCSACARVSHVDGLQGFRLPWPCTWCGHFNAGFSQNQDPATARAAELAAEVAADEPAHGTPGAPPPSGPASPATRPRRRGARRIAALVVAVAACASAAWVFLGTDNGGAMRMTAELGGPRGVTRAVHVTADRAGAIDFQGVPGTLTVIGTKSGPVTLTGQLHGATVETRLNHAGGALRLSIRCPRASRCTENLRLTVPGSAGTTVRQPGGRIVVTGLAGPLRITAASADVTASGLRSPSLTTTITNGHLRAAFTVPPRQVSVTLASAQATLCLPARTAYRVTQHVTSGHVSVAIPQASTATRSVTASIHSGELNLLPDQPAATP